MIALTHMRTPNDIRLAENVEEIDLILGGHDHVYEELKVRYSFLLKFLCPSHEENAYATLFSFRILV